MPRTIRSYGEQEGRHFHGYYDCYCYLPLYIFCGRHLLAAKLRSSSADAADGSVEEVARIVGQIRERWPTTSIVIRADSGFCRDDLMSRRLGVSHATVEQIGVELGVALELQPRREEALPHHAHLVLDLALLPAGRVDERHIGLRKLGLARTLSAPAVATNRIVAARKPQPAQLLPNAHQRQPLATRTALVLLQ